MHVLLAVYDRKTEMFGPVVQERSEVAALRSFGDVLS